MESEEERYLLELWDRNICPFCARSIPEGKRVGSGKRSQGGFCSLDCYTRYYQLELTQRAQRLAVAVGDQPRKPQ